MYYVYIIYSQKLDKKYIGYSADLRDRIREHNSGKSAYTSKGVPWQLLYYEAYIDEMAARKQELFYKTGQGRRVLNKRLSFLKDEKQDNFIE